MQIEKNKVVTLSYELKVATGEVVDAADVQHPFAFIHGVGQTLPAFDEKLNGLKVGDEFKFDLSVDEAYGPINDNDIVSIPREVFQAIPDEEFSVGMELPLQDKDGNQFYGTVREINTDMVLMDFNHPLAGQALSFSGTVIGVRAATSEEIDHGHVHGEGGHHH